jgi:hypothetical protein
MVSPGDWLFRFPQRIRESGKTVGEHLFLAALAAILELGDDKVPTVHGTSSAPGAHLANCGMSLASALSAASICSTAMPP